MIPIRDAVRSNHFPLVNFMIIGLNGLAFLWQLAQGSHLQEAFFFFGVVPARYSDPADCLPFYNLPTAPSLRNLPVSPRRIPAYSRQYVVSLYLRRQHRGPARTHPLPSLLSPLRDRRRFNPPCNQLEFQIPTIGASGAIAGVMGAYLLLYPSGQDLNPDSDLLLFSIR